MSEINSDKSRTVVFLLALFLGALGIHRFYVGKVGTGLLMLITGGLGGLWWIFDVVMVLIGSFTDKEGRRVFNW